MSKEDTSDQDESVSSPEEEEDTPTEGDEDEGSTDSPTEDSGSDDEDDDGLIKSSDEEDDNNEDTETEIYLPPPEEDHYMFQPVKRKKLDLTSFGLAYIDSIIRLVALLLSFIMGSWIILATTICISDKQTHDYAKKEEGGRDCYLWTICVRTRFISYCHFGFCVLFALEFFFDVFKVYVKWCQFDNIRFMRQFTAIFIPLQLIFHFTNLSFFVANTAFTGIASPIQWQCSRGINPIVERYLPQMRNIMVAQYAVTLFQLGLFCYSLVLFFLIIFATVTYIMVNVEFKFEDEFKHEMDNLSDEDDDSWKWKGR